MLEPTQPPIQRVSAGFCSEGRVSSDLLPKLRMSGAILVRPPYDFTACRGTGYPNCEFSFLQICSFELYLVRARHHEAASCALQGSVLNTDGRTDSEVFVDLEQFRSAV